MDETLASLIDEREMLLRERSKNHKYYWKKINGIAHRFSIKNRMNKMSSLIKKAEKLRKEILLDALQKNMIEFRKNPLAHIKFEKLIK